MWCSNLICFGATSPQPASMVSSHWTGDHIDGEYVSIPIEIISVIFLARTFIPDHVLCLYFVCVHEAWFLDSRAGVSLYIDTILNRLESRKVWSNRAGAPFEMNYSLSIYLIAALVRWHNTHLRVSYAAWTRTKFFLAYSRTMEINAASQG